MEKSPEQEQALKKLAEVRKQIEAILKENDVAAYFIFHLPNVAKCEMFTDTSYSCVTPNDGFLDFDTENSTPYQRMHSYDMISLFNRVTRQSQRGLEALEKRLSEYFGVQPLDMTYMAGKKNNN